MTSIRQWQAADCIDFLFYFIILLVAAGSGEVGVLVGRSFIKELVI